MQLVIPRSWQGSAIALATAALGLLLLAAPAQADLPNFPAPKLPPQSLPTQLIVGFKSGVSQHQQDKIIARVQGSRRARLGRLGAGVVKPRAGMGIDRLRQALMRNRDVSYVEPDQEIQLTATPNDPLAVLQYQYGLTGRPTGSLAELSRFDSIICPGQAGFSHSSEAVHCVLRRRAVDSERAHFDVARNRSTLREDICVAVPRSSCFIARFPSFS